MFHVIILWVEFQLLNCLKSNLDYWYQVSWQLLESTSKIVVLVHTTMQYYSYRSIYLLGKAFTLKAGTLLESYKKQTEIQAQGPLIITSIAA